jgi:hypothetical protein
VIARETGSYAAAARAPAQIDAVGEQGGERAELLCNDERRVVRQHAVRADTDRARTGRNVADDDGRRRTRNARDVVMLGHPEAAIAPAFRVPRKVDRIVARGRARRFLRCCGRDRESTARPWVQLS